ncbi:MAG: hypothetical protein C0482_10535 [Gordonia sp.]|nr:hypothetical protein [Gordonia sp. (in: high G+C Gram-positive bacteria)]
MARTWLSVTVELLGGRGDELWPRPGRTFAVGPAHTFLDFATAVNDAFARWDRSQSSMFVLADGRMVTDVYMAAEMSGSIHGPITEPLDIASAKVPGIVKPGDEFQFTFDLGDDWVHRCVVGADKVDPVQVLGIKPPKPLPYWGWGDIPDQYGRRWADDDRQGAVPARPDQPHPMLQGSWPGREQVPALDQTALRAAIATADSARFLAVVTGHDVDDALQQLGAGIAMALKQRRKQAEPVALSVLNRLTSRASAGDAVLADDILAHLRGVPLAGRVLPIELDMLGDALEGGVVESSGGYVDLITGEVYDGSATDADVVGDDMAINVEEDPDRWLWFDRADSQSGWRDMATFTERQRDGNVRERLERAIEGKGAFSRFRDVVYGEGLGDRWNAFSTDRRIGRAREFLADNGIRVG